MEINENIQICKDLIACLDDLQATDEKAKINDILITIDLLKDDLIINLEKL